MIPRRIKLTGFLSYQTEQEISFDGASLWMLTGLNGSGKSSVFDAMTYALFGYHRGGASNAIELINKNSNGFTVEFEFWLEGELHLIRRTLKRRASGQAATQQVLKSVNGAWQAVPDTQRKTEFERWIRDYIGLNFETFTSSVLLLQGHAEKLLDSTNKGRAEVLASIVDLERYQRLHERADNRRKTIKGQVETLEVQFEGIPEITTEERTAAVDRVEIAGAAARSAQVEVERLQALEHQAKQWLELQRKLTAARTRNANAAKIMQEANAIEKDMKRLRELREVLPHIETILHQRTALGESEERTKELTRRLRESDQKLAGAEHRLEQARLRKSTIQELIAADEVKQQAAASRLSTLAIAIERIKTIDEARANVARLRRECEQFPADLEAQVGAAKTWVEEVTAWHAAHATLSRFEESRRGLGPIREQASRASNLEREVKERGERMRAELDQLRPAQQTAKTELGQSQEKLTAARTLRQQAEGRCVEFERLDAASECDACGQPLTAQHRQFERARREKQKADAVRRETEALFAHEEAAKRENELSDRIRGLEEQIQTARVEYRDARGELQRATDELARLMKECGQSYAELPEPFRRRIAIDPPSDWAATTFPTKDQLDEARRDVAALPALRKKLDSLLEVLSNSNQARKLIQSENERLTDLLTALEGEPAAIRREHVKVEADYRALVEQLLASRETERGMQTEIEGLMADLSQSREDCSTLAGKLATEENSRQHVLSAIAAARKALSPDWQTRVEDIALQDLHRLRGERGELEANGTDARAEQLQSARIEVESLKFTLHELESEEIGFPADARRDAAEVSALLASARVEFAGATEAWNNSRGELANLDQRSQARRQLSEQLGEAQREHKYFKLLAELLGRDRLQRHLVRQAERQIVNYANGALDRLSSGQLMLRLIGSDDGAAGDSALDLEAYNRVTGQEAINVKFLSGSQRFRVAVSLALGIGQYASRLHRPIESVIIDEGFGCLDRNGRQVMIQELQNLRGHLKCILVVSHQEEFADAFADSYRFELANGTTRISRIHR